MERAKYPSPRSITSWSFSEAATAEMNVRHSATWEKNSRTGATRLDFSPALASVPVMFLGAWGLSRHLDAADRLAMAALVIFGLASIAVANAAVLDGLVAPQLIRHIVASAADAAKKDGWQLALRTNFEMNQAYARLYAVASAVAILLWSAAILRKGQFARAAGIYGCILGPATVGAVCSGLLRPDVHGFGMLVVCQAIWFVAVGAKLCGDVRS